MEKMQKYIVWFLLNLIWWVASIWLGTMNIDVNPFLDNLGEIVLNAIILAIGLIWINFTSEKIVEEAPAGTGK